jgi:membrane protein DedA with SNARE-associated domain
VLNSLAHWIQDQVAAHGLSAIFVLMVLESACIPIPSEVTMIYAGYLVSQDQLVFWQAVLVGAVANLVGSWIAWGVGAYGVDYAILRVEHNRRHIDQATRWFERYGNPVVFFARMLPVVRTFISLPAGVARMPFVRFSVLTFLGCLPWCFALVWIGDAAGSSWDTWHKRVGYLDYLVVVALVALAGWWLLRRRRREAV